MYCRNHTSHENFKLKLCTCAQSHALGTRTQFQLEIFTLALHIFTWSFCRACETFVKQPLGPPWGIDAALYRFIKLKQLNCWRIEMKEYSFRWTNIDMIYAFLAKTTRGEVVIKKATSIAIWSQVRLLLVVNKQKHYLSSFNYLQIEHILPFLVSNKLISVLSTTKMWFMVAS